MNSDRLAKKKKKKSWTVLQFFLRDRDFKSAGDNSFVIVTGSSLYVLIGCFGEPEIHDVFLSWLVSTLEFESDEQQLRLKNSVIDGIKLLTHQSVYGCEHSASIESIFVFCALYPAHFLWCDFDDKRAASNLLLMRTWCQTRRSAYMCCYVL